MAMLKDYAQAVATAYSAKGMYDRADYGPQDATEVQVERGAVSYAELALEDAQELSQRVMALVGRLLGPYPTEATADGKLASNGVFPSLRDRAERTSRMAQQAHSALNRLDRELP